jgi:uncharacterized protein YdaU (DUF1376 family)
VGGLNYYKRHLGDYAKDTSHLSALEVGIYDLLLDRYYATERPLRADEVNKFARARTAQERATVQSVLEEFFERDGELWRHGKCDEVIAEAVAKTEANRKNGPKGGRPRNVSRGTIPDGSGQEPKANPEITQVVSSGLAEKTLATTPLATSQETERPRKRGSRLPKPFECSADWVREAQRVEAEMGAPLAVRIEVEFAKFCDHWRGQSGQKGVKDDWDATWRNWIRKSIEWSNPNGSKKSGRNPSLAEQAAESERVAAGWGDAG